MCQTFDVHRSSYRHWPASANEPDGERVVKRSKIMETWNASGRLCRRPKYRCHRQQGLWRQNGPLAGKLMKELNIASCQIAAHKYKRGGNEHVEIPNHLDRQFAVTGPGRTRSGAAM